MATAYPETIAVAADIIRGAAEHDCLQITGNGTHYPADTGTLGLSAAKMSGIRIYRPSDWTITVSAGTPIAQINDVVSPNGQRLAFNPPVDRRSDGSSPKPTIGGAIATNAGEPRPAFGSRLQDSLLGMRFINGNGEIIDAGSRAIKNVAGIALARGLVGSWGNLALICDITLRLIPNSPQEQMGAAPVRNSDGAMPRFFRPRTDMPGEFQAINLPVSSPSRITDRLNARIKQAFDPKGVFSSKPYLSRAAV